MDKQSHAITINFTDEEAQAFAHLLKRTVRKDFEDKASDGHEALKMQEAARVVSIAIAEVEMASTGTPNLNSNALPPNNAEK